MQRKIDPGWCEEVETFDDALIQAVDEALMSFSESVKKIIYFHLKNKYSIKREDIPEKPECFVLAIQSLLGMGASSVTILVLKILCKKYGLNYELLNHRNFKGDIEEIKGKIAELERGLLQT
jgi:hypothetical protein